jgi:hypothetical protein
MCQYPEVEVHIPYSKCTERWLPTIVVMRKRQVMILRVMTSFATSLWTLEDPGDEHMVM